MNDDLTGQWLGIYRYDTSGFDPVSYAADLVQSGDVLDGTTVEPNSFAPSKGAELSGQLTGTCHGGDVAFTKTYPGVQDDPVEYVGLQTLKGEKIEGRWFFPTNPTIKGSFRMWRKKRAGAKAEQKAKATVD